MTKLHQARLAPWTAGELRAHLSTIVDGLVEEGPDEVSPLKVALALLGGELEAFVLFARMGHLDPRREDGKVPVGILRQASADPEVDDAIRRTVQKWGAEQGTDHRIGGLCDVAPSSSAEDLRTEVRSMFAKLPVSVLGVAVEVHRLMCRVADCPVLSAMESVAIEQGVP